MISFLVLIQVCIILCFRFESKVFSDLNLIFGKVGRGFGAEFTLQVSPYHFVLISGSGLVKAFHRIHIKGVETTKGESNEKRTNYFRHVGSIMLGGMPNASIVLYNRNVPDLHVLPS